MTAHIFPKDSSGLKDISNIEFPLIKVDEKIDQMLTFAYNQGITALEREPEASRAAKKAKFEVMFWSGIHYMKIKLRDLELRWKADVDAMENAFKSGDLQRVLYFKQLAFSDELNYETVFKELVFDVLAEVGRVQVQNKKIVQKLERDLEHETNIRKKLAERAKQALLKR